MNELSGYIIWVPVAIAALSFYLWRGGRWRSHDRGRRGSDEPCEPCRDGRTGAEPAAELDPVTGNPVRTDRALTAAFGGRVYYFESEDTRKRFESDPQRYASTEPPSKQPPRPRGDS